MSATTQITAEDRYPVASLSMYDPVHMGIDEFGFGVDIELIYHNILLAGEPGAGKSVELNNIVAHGALCIDSSMWLFDGKQVELGLWEDVSDVFVGPDMGLALRRLRQLQLEMNRRYAELSRVNRRKIIKTDPVPVILAVIDELAYYSVTTGTKDQREEFMILLRDIIARGRAAGIIMVAATQRPVRRHHPDLVAGPVRLPPRLPLHHRFQLRHRAVGRLGRAGLLRQGHRPRGPGRWSAAR